jgi:hypothetical protein
LLTAGCAGLNAAGPANPTAESMVVPLGSGQLVAAEDAPLALPQVAQLDRTAGDRRQASELFNFNPITLRGDAFIFGDSDAAVNPDYNSASLPAGSRDSTWVIYHFYGLEADALLGYLEAVITDAAPQVLYYALADYAAGAWQWYSLAVPELDGLNGVISHSLEQGGDYISDDGSLYFAVATWDNVSCQVLRCSLHVGVREIYVQGLSATDGDFADEIAISWEALEGSTGYELYFRLTEFSGPLVLLAEVAGGDTAEFIHSETNPPEHTALKDTQYIYFIMAVFADGYRSQLSGWDTGYCGELE